jgi:hypothetical protein
LEGDVGGWDEEDGRVGGFEDAEGVGGVGEEDAVVEDADVAGGGFEARGTRVVPYGFDGWIVWCGVVWWGQVAQPFRGRMRGEALKEG